MESKGRSEEQRERDAYLAGAKWIVNNYANCLFSPTKTVLSRWGEWITDPQFSTMRQEIHQLYETDQTFRNACDIQVKRHTKGSLEYVLEECAVLPLWAPFADNIIYPGAIGPAIRVANSALNLRFALTEVRIRS